MLGGKITLKGLLLILLLILLAMLYQQYDSYLQFRKQLTKSDVENRILLMKVENTKRDKDAFAQRYARVSERYAALRMQLPVDMNLEAFKKSLDEAFKSRGVKILAQREAHNYRSFYHEVRISYSLKGNMSGVMQIIKTLENEPRLVIFDEPRDEGNNTVSLGLSIFSTNSETQIKTKRLECISKPVWLVVPLFLSEIDRIYKQYSLTCHALSRNADIYAELQRYEQMVSAVNILESIKKSIIREQ